MTQIRAAVEALRTTPVTGGWVSACGCCSDPDCCPPCDHEEARDAADA